MTPSVVPVLIIKLVIDVGFTITSPGTIYYVINKQTKFIDQLAG